MTRCNNCMKVFKNDEELEMLQDDNGFFKGCPTCKTDSFLMDVDYLKCTICGELVENLMNELETHLTGHEVDFNTNDMQDVLEYFDSVEEDEEDGDNGIVRCGVCGKSLKRCEAFLSEKHLYTCNDCED
jgi:hypothetical protein